MISWCWGARDKLCADSGVRRWPEAGDVEQENADNPKIGTEFGSSGPTRRNHKGTGALQKKKIA